MKCVDLFSGCGGLSLGFELAGFEICAAFENWEKAIEIYKNNFSHPIYNIDLRNEKEAVEKIKKYSPDLIMGGPPCQDFSSAGKRDISLGRADLTYSFANIVCNIRPKWFVMENVEQIKKSHILQDIINQFIDFGYGLTSAILDASYCGVPQSRTRFFLIGKLNSEHNFLIPTLSRKLSDKPMTVRDYLGNSLNLEFYYRHPRNYNRRGIFSIDEPSPTIRGVNRPIPKGYNINSCDPKGVELAKVRPLTTIERSYIQTFPKSFLFSGTKTDLEQMIGNAVPVNLAKFIASAIINFEKEPIRSMGQIDLFENKVSPFILSEKVLHKIKEQYIYQ
ncbi:DNA cytosine methyltransferase [Haemophilus influenzae]|uniref:DNA cytosine methyltransferase n=1 Tax=Haemophilus influenzae TaxID=727 RepID=UPI0005AF3117|nr:DNA cytosine methyltransferase [Haemophilus influenzae]AXP62103.1 DNA cytosine methyltransferase [Haemophilus influenzae]KIP51121.1 modification methylase [Haemophilus influenzae]MCK9672928.1 DNA cytosine methyltransferase [Haemophilus influenzae]MCK9681339.1 DNA cytosine methyltransferase [Haemophilus influenzae]RFN98381.1 DNA cytosine methyltransferase [Haemophilus influenzae]